MAKLILKAKEGGGDFELITPGTYDFCIVSAKATEDKDGNPQMHAEFEIAEGELAGKKTPQWLGTTEERGWALKALLDAAGVPYEVLEAGDEQNAPTLSFDTDDCLMRFVRAELSHYTNTRTNKTYHNLGKWEASPLQAAAEGNSSTEQAAPPAETAAPAEAPKPAQTAAKPATSQVRRGTPPARSA